MKKIAAPIRVELAQYRELAAFSQFGSELDADTREKLAQGERIREVLKQPQYQPMPTEEQVASIFAAARGHLDDIDVDRVLPFEKGLLEMLRSVRPDILQDIRERKKLDDDLEVRLNAAIEEFKASFQAEG